VSVSTLGCDATDATKGTAGAHSPGWMPRVEPSWFSNVLKQHTITEIINKTRANQWNSMGYWTIITPTTTKQQLGIPDWAFRIAKLKPLLFLD